MEIKVKGYDFISAMELADDAECENAEKEEILQKGRQHFAKKLASVISKEDNLLVSSPKVRARQVGLMVSMQITYAPTYLTPTLPSNLKRIHLLLCDQR